MLQGVITRSDIERMYRAIFGYLRRTPVIDIGARAFDRPGTGSTVLKLEQLQCSGSFKVRGAFADLILRTPITAFRQVVRPPVGSNIGPTPCDEISGLPMRSLGSSYRGALAKRAP